ncbi:MAG: peptidoglycan bridge formation glycyltransferase FemA/FemB family protein [Chloroflexota bacterium]
MTDVTAARAVATDAPPSTAPSALPTTGLLASDDAAWDAFVAAAPNGSFPQLTAWAEANATKGWRAQRVVVPGPTGPVGAQLLIHRMRPGPWSRAYAPRGPVAATLDRGAIDAFTAGVRDAARAARIVHVTIDPEVAVDGPVPGWLKAAGWEPAGEIQIDDTRIIDLRHTEAELWSDLRSSARWSVNKARRSGFVVRETGAAGLDAFAALYLETAARVGFEPSAAFREVYAAWERRGGARLLVAYGPTGDPAATLMLLDCGDRVIELYGASSREGAQGRANHLIKWEAIRSSAERGMARYDMWGTDEVGVATFKASFGGAERSYIGAWRLTTDRAAALTLGSAAQGRTLARRTVHAAADLRPGVRSELPAGVTVTATAPDGWNAIAVDAPGGHVMQGTAWADHRRSQGAQPRFVTFGASGGAASPPADVRGALVVLRAQRLVPGLIATARKGPITAGDPIDLVAARAVTLADTARALGATELFLDPEIDADPAWGAAMDRAGCAIAAEVQPSIHVMRLTLPADRDPDALLASFSKSTRQRIRAAEKAGTVIRIDTTGEHLPRFADLLVARADDLGIPMRPELGYTAFWKRLLDAGQARLYVADHEGEVLGGLIVFLQGNRYATAYSADDATRRRELPGTMHLVRATLLRDALLAGAEAVDLGGVDLPGRREPPKPGDPNHGLYEHKSSFGAVWVVREPARRIVLRPWADRAARLSREALVTARRLKPGR